MSTLKAQNNFHQNPSECSEEKLMNTEVEETCEVCEKDPCECSDENTISEKEQKMPQLSDGLLCDVVDLDSYVRRSEILACLPLMCDQDDWHQFIQDSHDHSVDFYNDGDLRLALAKAEVANTAYMLQFTLRQSNRDRLCEKHMTEQLEKEREMLLSLNKLKIVNMMEANCSDDEIKSVDLIKVAEYSKAS